MRTHGLIMLTDPPLLLSTSAPCRRILPAALEDCLTNSLLLQARPWPTGFHGTTRAAVEEYHALSARIERLSAQLQVSPIACCTRQWWRGGGRAGKGGDWLAV